MNVDTDRLHLRYFNKHDAEDLFEYLSQDKVIKYEPYNVYSKQEAYKEVVNRSNDSSFIAVCLLEKNKVIGNLYLSMTNPQKVNTYQIGFVFNENFQGFGYASEAVRALLDNLFTKYDAHRVIAMCNTKNIKSWRLLEKLGFRREATRVKNMYLKKDDDGSPIWFNSYQYALLKEEWF